MAITSHCGLKKLHFRHLFSIKLCIKHIVTILVEREWTRSIDKDIFKLDLRKHFSKSNQKVCLYLAQVMTRHKVQYTFAVCSYLARAKLVNHIFLFSFLNYTFFSFLSRITHVLQYTPIYTTIMQLIVILTWKRLYR